MVRQRIQIKKIDNISARQVTFSKRRRGLFKKANELSTLCDAEIALIVFSATGKLFEFSSSSMKQVIERHKLQAENLGKLSLPSLDLQLENGNLAMLRKEIAEKNQKLRQLRGEELHGLNFEELMKLEKMVEGGMSRVLKTKCERYENEISSLKAKEAQMREENLWLKQQMKEIDMFVVQRHGLEQGQSSESITNNCSFANNPPPPPPPLQDYDSSDTSLKLGLPFPN